MQVASHGPRHGTATIAGAGGGSSGAGGLGGGGGGTRKGGEFFHTNEPPINLQAGLSVAAGLV